MTTKSRDTKTFTQLLDENREIITRYIACQLLDAEDPTVRANLSREESLVYEQMARGALETRNELFSLGAQNGLTDKEITVALLNPIAYELRPTLATGGCGCRRCEARRERDVTA